MIDDKAQKFGLPTSLLVPIAARSVAAIERYVGTVFKTVRGRTGRINAVAVVPNEWPPQTEPDVALWQHPEAVQESVREALECDIVYADPMDLTKMLDIPPGTQALAGVGKLLKLFYPE